MMKMSLKEKISKTNLLLGYLGEHNPKDKENVSFVIDQSKTCNIYHFSFYAFGRALFSPVYRDIDILALHKHIGGRYESDKQRLIDRLKNKFYIEPWRGKSFEEIEDMYAGSGYLMGGGYGLSYISGPSSIILKDRKRKNKGTKIHLIMCDNSLRDLIRTSKKEVEFINKIQKFGLELKL